MWWIMLDFSWNFENLVKIWNIAQPPHKKRKLQSTQEMYIFPPKNIVEVQTCCRRQHRGIEKCCMNYRKTTVAESPNRQLKMASEKILITCSDLICLLWKLVQHDPIQKQNMAYWAEIYYSQYSWKVTLRFAPIGSEMRFPRSFASKKCPKLC